MIQQARLHWSYSAINQYLRCPLQFYFQRVLKLPQPCIGSGLVLGSALHQALAVYHQGLMKQEQIDREKLRQEFRTSWVQKESAQKVDYKPSESRTALIEQGLALLDLYLAEPAPEKIVGVEQRFLVPLHNSEGEYLETPLLAFMDLVTQENNTLKVTEFKTSSRSYSEFEIDNSLQATCYAHAIMEMTGLLVNVEYAVFVKTKTPKLQRRQTTRHESDLSRLGDLVENIERAVEQQIFYPIENPLNCSGCCYRQQCKAWQPQRTTDEAQRFNLQHKGVPSC